MSKPPVLLNRPLPDYIASQFSPYCHFVPWEVLKTGTPAELAELQAVVIYGHTHVDQSILKDLPNIKVISNFGVGVDHINVADCDAAGVPLGNTPGAVDGATADMTFALMLAIARNLIIGDRYARGPDFTSFDPSLLVGKEVYGATLGIIGMGRIGQQVAKRARGFDMNVLYYNRNRNTAVEAELGARYTSMDELLGQADFVTLNVPLTADTRNLIGAAQLKMMRSDAMLINIARGGVVDHEALVQALRENWIGGAAIDVTEPEPLARDHPLLQLDNLVIAPHLGSATLGTRQWMGRMMVANLRAGLDGQPLPHQVTTKK